MFSFDNTYGFISRGTEQLVPQYSPCALQSEPKHFWYNDANSGVKKRQNKENKEILRMIA